MDGLKRTPLFNEHEKCGGKIIDFSGWALPVQYEGLVQEHVAVRERAGLFDVSHMGEVMVEGADAMAYVQNLVTNDVGRLLDGQVMYALMCNEDGGTVDDLLVYRKHDEAFLLVINAANIEKDFNWIIQNIGKFKVALNNISEATAEVAIQGPKAQAILQKISDVDLDSIQFFHFNEAVHVAGHRCLVSRTGYTGEDGFEVYANPEVVGSIWKKLIEVGAEYGLQPAGLGARDTLRFEASLPLYGNELSTEISPLEAGLGFFVKLDSGDFIGSDVLRRQKAEGLTRKIVGFEMQERGIPRNGYRVYCEDKAIGFVTTGYASPTVGKTIGLALVDSDYATLDREIQIGIRKKMAPAKIIKKRFLTKNYKK